MQTNSKPEIFIISGKSPIRDSGGYPAYANNLARLLTSLGYSVSLFAISDTSSVEKTKFGKVYFAGTRLVRLFPILRHLAMAGLPYYSIILYKTMRRTLAVSKTQHSIVWGMGPWGFPGVFLKLFPPQGHNVSLFTSYFTSTRHEMGGAYRALSIDDYGFLPKMKYFIVYEIIARVFQIIEQITLWWCDKIIVHYRSSENIVNKYFSLRSKQVMVRFPWYVDVFSRAGEGTIQRSSFPHPLIISVCRQDPRKGLNFVIRAMEHVVKTIPSAHYLIVGTGELLEAHKKLVHKLRLEQNITIVGFVPDIRPILKAADIAIVTPLAQGSSALTVLEAMSYKKAIIGSDCDGIPEDITHNISGLIVTPADSQSLARAMIRLLKNSKLRKRLGVNAYSAFKKRFGFKQLRKNIQDMLTEQIS